jgi:hypothetical protein
MDNLIFKKLIQVLQEVEAIRKDKKNQMQGYSFRGIDDMYNALHPLFSKHGVFITSEVVSGEREERQNAKGTLLLYSVVDVKFTFYAEDGSNVSSTLKGEAMDSGDKATNKAISAALKYCLMQMFLIPTEDLEDADKTTHEVAPKPEDERPWLSEVQLKKIITRIQAGEPELKEAAVKEFNMKKEFKQQILAA